jgi:uncharacterized protein
MSDPQSMPGHRWDSSRLLVEWQKDPQATLLRLRQAANAGDARAQFLLGQIHCEGRGVPIDAVEGLHWYRLAAHAGDATAMNMVGRCHELGRGTAVDESLAAAWYRKAASHGHDWGMYNYANLLATGRGVARDRGEALRLYREAAHQGHAKSMNLVGRYLEEGWEGPKDADAGHDWYRRSAEAGDFRGQASHAFVLAQKGRMDEAEGWLRQAVSLGSRSFLEYLRLELVAAAMVELRVIVELAGARLAGMRPDPGRDKADENPMQSSAGRLPGSEDFEPSSRKLRENTVLTGQSA